MITDIPGRDTLAPQGRCDSCALHDACPSESKREAGPTADQASGALAARRIVPLPEPRLAEAS
ncbi:hypothetical protein [Demequina salsinemoris]|uniref:hypothetical protein n=1 Tax=Demequina salsinemoris TaxID=577470 RepID=UPI0007819FE7|nr:hypothetical protein [Demequina salsinemoris]